MQSSPASAPASSDPVLPPPLNPSLVELLLTGEYGPLQQRLEGAQQAFERGELTEQQMEQWFAEFDTIDIRLGEHFRAWLDQAPPSYVAYTALARWLMSRAFHERGGGTSNLVSDRGYRAMHHLLEQAERSLLKAIELSALPLHAWSSLGQIANVSGNRIDPRDLAAERYPEWFKRGLDVAPHSLMLRQQMLRNLRTEWGGSENMMLDFIRQQDASGAVSAPNMQKLWAQFHAQVSHHAMYFTHDYSLALERAKAAAELDAHHLIGLLDAQVTYDKEHQGTLGNSLAILGRLLEQAEPLNIKPNTKLDMALYEMRDGLGEYATNLGRWLYGWMKKGDSTAAQTLGFLRMYVPYYSWPDPTPWLKQLRAKGDKNAAVQLVDIHELTLFGNQTDKIFTPNLSGADKASFREDIFLAAQLGSGENAWKVVQEFKIFAPQFDLEERDRLQFLLRAADQGNNQARVLLANMLLDGLAELGEDGVLRQMAGTASQDSLDYAQYLLKRAAASGDSAAAQQLASTKETDWDVKTRQAGSGLGRQVQHLRKAHNPQVYAQQQVEQRIQATKPTLKDSYLEWRSKLTWWHVFLVLWMIGGLVKVAGTIAGGP